eukprot:TRINITY_DN42006_c0_g1_i1.p1 TRINITY_DN42006_c0_g1~~TRINITY_DN42006_c0_g1_i1.p1  ORF type:complete len:645 (+),score=165.58 TRINITY_DN42006_c0_g1_i1:60-1994(+)
MSSVQSDSFPIAVDSDFTEFDELLIGFKSWMAGKVKDVTALDYEKKLKRNMLTYRKAPAHMASEAYLSWMKNEAVHASIASALKYFGQFWVEYVKRPVGVAAPASVKQEAAKAEPKSEPSDAIKTEDVKMEDVKSEVKSEEKTKDVKMEGVNSELTSGTKVKGDIASCPSKLVIEGSGKASVDGKYKLHPEVRNGRPVYELIAGKKPMFLYFEKHWIITHAIGEKGHLMSLKDADVMTPCEPYPYCWTGYKKDDEGVKTKLTRYGMRVRNAFFNEELLPLEPVESAFFETAAGVGDGEGEGDKPPPKKSRSSKSKSTASEEKASSPRRAKAAVATDPTKGKLAPAKAEPAKCTACGVVLDVSMPKFCGECGHPTADQPKVAPQKMSEGASSSSDASEAEESDSSDEEESSSSDSGTEKGKPAPQKSAAPKAAPPPAPPPPPVPKAPKELNQKAKDFQEKVRENFSKMTDAKQVKAKLIKMKEILATQNSAQFGMSPEQAKEFSVALEDEVKKRLEKDASAPPPEQGTKRKADAVQESLKPLHRMDVEPSKSALRCSWNMKKQTDRKIQYVDVAVQRPLSVDIPVESFRSLGEALWFFMPGNTVICDHCSRGVSQAMGTLLGAPNKSQFAQDQFLCSECLGANMM